MIGRLVDSRTILQSLSHYGASLCCSVLVVNRKVIQSHLEHAWGCVQESTSREDLLWVSNPSMKALPGAYPVGPGGAEQQYEKEAHVCSMPFGASLTCAGLCYLGTSNSRYTGLMIWTSNSSRSSEPFGL